MGSFNVNCAITKCAIVPHQLVRIFYLVQTNTKPEFKIVGFPLLASYNDRNKFNYIENESLDITLGNINQLSTSSFFNDINFFEDQVNKNNVFVNVNKSQNPVFKMVILESVFQKIILKQKIPFTNICFDLDFDDEFSCFCSDKLSFNEQIPLFSKLFNLVISDIEQNSKQSLYFKIRDKSFKIDFPQSFKPSFFSQYNTCKDKDLFISNVVSLYFIEYWFNYFSYDFTPLTFSNPDTDLRLIDSNSLSLFNIILNQNDEIKYFANNDVLKVNTKVTVQKEISLKQFEEIKNDWFLKSDADYQCFDSFILHLSNAKPEYFILGDNSDIDLFVKKYNLLPYFCDGTVININY